MTCHSVSQSKGMKAKKRSMAPEDGGDEASKRLKKEDDLARRPRRTATKVDYR